MHLRLLILPRLSGCGAKDEISLVRGQMLLRMVKRVEALTYGGLAMCWRMVDAWERACQEPNRGVRLNREESPSAHSSKGIRLVCFEEP